MAIQSIKNLPIITASASIEIVPLTRYKGENDIAKITVNLQLQQPLQNDTQFLVPNEEFKSQKIYLPDGNKVEIGDFDPTANEDVDALKPQIITSVDKFLDQPQNENLKEAVEKMTDYYEYKSASKIFNVPAGTPYISFSYTKNIEINTETGENILETTVPLPSFTFSNQGGSKASILVLMPFEISNQNNIIEALWTPPNGNPTPLNINNIAGRIALTGYWQYDPAIRIRYKY